MVFQGSEVPEKNSSSVYEVAKLTGSYKKKYEKYPEKLESFALHWGQTND
jgi:hypothetical protein